MNKIAQEIIKDCFWDTKISVDEIYEISKSDDFMQKKRLFEKILLNCTKMFHSLEIFKKEDLKELILGYKIPKFNHLHAKKRINLAKCFFLDLPLEEEELQWK